MRLKYISFLILAATFLSSASLPAKEAIRPNIVIFLTDDQSQLDATPYSKNGIRTPNMQRLADNGLTFDRAFVASPSCAPSRAAMLTGLMPARNGAEPNHSKPRAEVKKWPAYFQELGYEVVAFGKVSHYKQTSDYGFDYFAHDTFHDPEGIPSAIDWLKNRKRNNAKPLCIFVGSNWPHTPWPAKHYDYNPDKLSLPASSIDTPATREWRARYAEAVEKADNELGMVYETAQKTLGTNTLFLLSSDHGAKWPFGKWNLYDSGIRVPLIVSWPGKVKAGSRTDAMVSWIDFLPTLLEATGGNAPKNIDGRSFLPVLLGKKKKHRSEIFTTHSGDGVYNIYPMRSLRTDRWKYILNLHPEFAFTSYIDLPDERGQREYFDTWEKVAKADSEAAAIVNRYYQRPSEELYDLEKDPNEQHNLALEPGQASRLKNMRSDLNQWMQKQGDQKKVYNQPRLISDESSWGPKAKTVGGPTKPLRAK